MHVAEHQRKLVTLSSYIVQLAWPDHPYLSPHVRRPPVSLSAPPPASSDHSSQSLPQTGNATTPDSADPPVMHMSQYSNSKWHNNYSAQFLTVNFTFLWSFSFSNWIMLNCLVVSSVTMPTLSRSNWATCSLACSSDALPSLAACNPWCLYVEERPDITDITSWKTH